MFKVEAVLCCKFSGVNIEALLGNSANVECFYKTIELPFVPTKGMEIDILDESEPIPVTNDPHWLITEKQFSIEFKKEVLITHWRDFYRIQASLRAKGFVNLDELVSGDLEQQETARD